MKKRSYHSIAVAIMKISLIPVLILTFGWCSYANESSGQSLLDKRIALKIRNEEIKKVIYQIEKITDAKFMYSPQLIQSFRKVDLTVTNQKLSDVLVQLFTPLDIKYELVENYIILNAAKKGVTTSQGNPPRIITGKVVDENGQPLEGVSVKTQNGTAIAVTKADGRYSINVGEATDVILAFSSVGYISQEIQFGSKTVINITLKKLVTNLDDVVVIAYGKASRRSITNSIVSLSGKDVEDIPVASPGEAMVGLVAGANISMPSGEPGSAPVIRIRGVGSIGAGNNPLFVVDGYPLNSADNFNQISPADIQSIQVLKDAAACAIYGSRGGNGIILVTTKHGSAGKPKFNFTTHTGFQQVSKKVDVLNSSQFVSYLKDAYANGGTTLPVAYTDPNAVYANTDWQNAIFKTALQSNIQLSASGGSDNARYYIAGSYFKQEGIIKGTGTDRYSLRMNYDAKLSRKLNIGISMAPSFSRVDTRPISGTFNGSTITGGGSSIVGASVTDALLLPPVLPQFIANGDYGQYSNTGNLVTINIYNPVATLDLYQDHTNAFRGLGTTFLEWEILKGLTFKTNVGGEILFSRRNWYVPATLATASSTTANLSNPVLAGIAAQQINSNNYNWVWENTLNYSTTIGMYHKINLLAGYAAQRNTSEGSAVFGQAGTYTNGAIEYVTAAGQIFGSANYGANALVSTFGRLSYSYQDKYLLSAAIRTDGSSRFGSDNRYATFPSVSAAWRMTEEKFMKKLRYVSELKIRGSYGVTGNNNIGDFSWQSYQTAANYIFGSNAGTRVYGFIPNSVSVKNLTWETNKQIDAGLELGLFNNRVYLTVDAYQRNTTNLLLNRNVPGLIGFTTRVLNNVGEVRNQGLEFALTTQNTTGKLKWTTTANLFFNNNKVMALTSDNDQILFDAVNGYTSSIKVVKGQPLSSFFGYKQTGVYMSAADVAKSPVWAAGGSQPGDIKYADVSGPNGKPDGKIDANDITLLGNALPKYSFGILNSFAYKNFQFSFNLQGSVGGLILNGVDRYIYNFYGKVNARTNALNRWRSEADPGDGWTPKVTTAPSTALTSFSSHELFDASFLRVRNVTLRYALDKRIVSKLRLQTASLYVTAQNLFTLTGYFGYNPEANLYGNTTNPTYGVDQGSYPLARTVTFGLSVGF